MKVNKVLKMDFRGQTAVLSAFVLVGMVFLVPAITEKALAIIIAKATGTCGPEGQTRPCEFKVVNQGLYSGKWDFWPRVEGTSVTWQTSGNPAPGDEKGWVSVNFGLDVGAKSKDAKSVTLDFDNPAQAGTNGSNNKCHLSPSDAGTCHPGSGYTATFTYTLHNP